MSDEFVTYSSDSDGYSGSDDGDNDALSVDPDLNTSIAEEVVDGTVIRTVSYMGKDGTEWKNTPIVPNAQTRWPNVVTVPRNCIPETQNVTSPAEVNHSQQLSNNPHSPWVLIDVEGRVLLAHCDCMAGLCESCTHVAAVLFNVEGCHRLCEQVTVTGEPSYWSAPAFKSSAEPTRVKDIVLASANTQRKALTYSSVKATRPKQLPKFASVDPKIFF
ncbi:YqaJ viral recombinase domain [Elysia marginata]|uniref:YqaJ viral recombinase domain n=1 Tax=Elysia marginata TaxID=1093978 RepID=A0AAV4HJ20_9GAST|nr:YqaJ viral recombinase domain [Elysia marginata]